jgi:hypothetical protein
MGHEALVRWEPPARGLLGAPVREGAAAELPGRDAAA